MTAVALSVYFLLGFALFLFADRAQMKKHVPYEELPAGIPLSTIRFVVAVFDMLFGVPITVMLVVKAFFRKPLPKRETLP